MVNKRKHPRVKIQFRSQFSTKGQMLAGDGELRDLSPGGCRITSQSAVHVGAQLEICIFPGDDSTPLMIDTGFVRWVKNNEFGIMFGQVRPQAQRRLNDLCRRLAPIS